MNTTISLQPQDMSLKGSEYGQTPLILQQFNQPRSYYLVPVWFAAGSKKSSSSFNHDFLVLTMNIIDEDRKSAHYSGNHGQRSSSSSRSRATDECSIRARNNEQVRRTRRRKREEERRMKQEYVKNERRIVKLEALVKVYSEELCAPRTSKSSKREKSPKSFTRKGLSDSVHPVREDRPSWFGDPFWMPTTLICGHFLWLWNCYDGHYAESVQYTMN